MRYRRCGASSSLSEARLTPQTIRADAQHQHSASLRNTARAQKRAEHPEHKRPRAQTFLGHAKGAGGAPPHAGVAGRILRLQFRSNYARLLGRLLGGLLRRGLTSGRLLRGSRLCGRLLSRSLLSRGDLLRGGLTLDRALRALVSK